MKKTVNYLAILSCSILGITLAHADGYDGHHLKPYPTYPASSSSSSMPSSSMPSSSMSSTSKPASSKSFSSGSSASTSSAASYKTSSFGPVSSEYYKTGPIVNVPDSDASKGGAAVTPSDYYKTYRL